MADAGQDAANLAVAAFIQHNDQIGAVTVFFFHVNRLSASKTFRQMNALFEAGQLPLVGSASHSH